MAYINDIQRIDNLTIAGIIRVSYRNYSGTPDLTINIRKREAFATLI